MHRDTLQHPPLVDYMAQQLIVWGGNISDKYGREAEVQCEVMGYPFLAVYMPKTRKTFQLVYTSHGTVLHRNNLWRVVAVVYILPFGACG